MNIWSEPLSMYISSDVSWKLSVGGKTAAVQSTECHSTGNHLGKWASQARTRKHSQSIPWQWTWRNSKRKTRKKHDLQEKIKTVKDGVGSAKKKKKTANKLWNDKLVFRCSCASGSTACTEHTLHCTDTVHALSCFWVQVPIRAPGRHFVCHFALICARVWTLPLPLRHDQR